MEATQESVTLTAELVHAMMARGLTQTEAMDELGMSRWKFYNQLYALGIKWKKQAVRCRYGHDRRVHGFVDANGQNRCRICAQESKIRYNTKHATEPKPRPDGAMTAGQVAAKLARDAELENAPPWVRHPQPWD